MDRMRTAAVWTLWTTESREEKLNLKFYGRSGGFTTSFLLVSPSRSSAYQERVVRHRQGPADTLVLVAWEARKGTPNTQRKYWYHMVSFLFFFFSLFPDVPAPKQCHSGDDRHWKHNSARPKTLRKGKLPFCSVKLRFQEDWWIPFFPFFLPVA